MMQKVYCLFTLVAIAITIHAQAEIVFEFKEFNPKGANYKTKVNLPYYSIYTKGVEGERLTLIYSKEKDQLVFKCFWISKALEARLPVVVFKHIGKYITDPKLQETKSVQKALEATHAAVNKALDQTWKNNLVTHAQTMVKNLRYHRGNSVMDDNKYYEFMPSHLNAPDSTKPNYVEKPLTWASGFQSGGESRKNLDALITYITSYREHHNTEVVSDWNWIYSGKKWELKTDTAHNHLKKIDTCKLKLELKLVNKGEKMPIMCWKQIYGAYWAKPPTYCNFFAQALAVRTFNKGSYDPEKDPGTNTPWYPWAKHGLANEIHDYMVAHPELFVDLKWQDCWKYINAGYIVYFVWKNPDGAGHIATGYPTSSTISIKIGKKDTEVGHIVQAGVEGKTKVLQLEGGAPWAMSQLNDVKTFLYLGYLNF